MTLRSAHPLTLEQALRRDIASGTLAPAGRLPSEREMIAIYATTRITLREALRHIEIDGLIYRETRRGWFTAGPRLIYDPLRHSNFHQMATEQSRKASTELISATSGTAPAHICQLMDCSQDTEFWVITRRRWIDDRLVLYVEHYLSKQIFPDILQFDLNNSLSGIYLDYYHIQYGSARFEISPIALRGTAARKLNCGYGSYGLHILRVNKDQYGRTIDCDSEFWRHHSISVSVEAS